MTRPAEPAPVEIVWEGSRVAAVRAGRPVTELSWHRCGDGNGSGGGDGTEVEVTAGPCRSAEADVASELLTAALTHLAVTGVRSVHLTLVAGEPQTPALLRAVQHRTPAGAPSPTGQVVADVRMHAAGNSALVDLVLRGTDGPPSHDAVRT